MVPLKKVLMYLPSICNGLVVTILPEVVMVALFVNEEITGDDKRVPANAIKEASIE